MNIREMELMLDGIEKTTDERIQFWKDRCDELLELVNNYRILTQESLERLQALIVQVDQLRDRERQLRDELRVERAR
jgi:hypothetical protein